MSAHHPWSPIVPMALCFAVACSSPADPGSGGGSNGGGPGEDAGVDSGGGTADSNTGGNSSGSGNGGSNGGGTEDAGSAVCGDGTRQDPETCDDSNELSDDGCSDVCEVEKGWACPADGGECAAECGDGRLLGTEQCDDDNVKDGDGCSARCETEKGWACPTVGESCVAGACGDGIVAGSEQCDDADDLPGDGCDVGCQLENGWVCLVAGAECTPAECGDGFRVGAEMCDDGNATAGDGCTVDCVREPFHSCPIAGGACSKTTVCGDGLITPDEECDDNNPHGDDGCSARCQREEGWVCAAPGSACTPAECGDGIQVGPEQCDTGDAGGPGCDSECNLEPDYHCPTPGQACQDAVCGNGVREGLEACDDGAMVGGEAVPNNDLGDGCTPGCKAEPQCSDGVCLAICGDAEVGAGEDCDDGNTRSNDGCSKDCEFEPGYDCVLLSEGPGDSVTIPIVYRDFRGHDLGPAGGSEWGTPLEGHYAFQGRGGGRGMVEAQLDADGKPDSNGSNAGALGTDEEFGQWYRDSDMSITVVDELQLDLVAGQPGTYAFSQAGFYPLTGRGFNGLDASDSLFEALRDPNDSPDNENFHFTSELRYWFEYEGDEVLTFRGDDDVWVFINGVLAVDIGGVHSAAAACISLTGDRTDCPANDEGLGVNNRSVRSTIDGSDSITPGELGLTVGGTYEVVVFQAERNTTRSNYKLTLNGFFTERTECVAACGDGVVTPGELCDSGGNTCVGGSSSGVDCSDSGEALMCVDDGGGSCGNDGGYGECQAGCDARGPHCGDSLLQADNEQCDEGYAGNIGSYGEFGCNADCTTGPFCGDANVDGFFGEQCDNGNTCDGGSADGEVCKGDDDCTGGSCTTQNVGGYDGCRDDCTFGDRCGDGTKQGDQGEECDEGINTSGYGGCAPGCVLAPFCGDGNLDAGHGEECDRGTNKNNGKYGGCRSNCKLAARCGDGKVQSDDEQCDDGNLNNFDGCSDECELENILI